MKLTELRKKEKSELLKVLDTERKKLTEKKLEKILNKNKDTSIYTKSRKQMARILTVVKEKEIINE